MCLGVASLYVARTKAKEQSAAEKNRPSLTSDQRKLLQSLEADRTVEIEPDRSRALVDPLFWSALDIHAKENLALSLAIICADRRGDARYDVDVVDRQSGKTLANYGAFGFSIK